MLVEIKSVSVGFGSEEWGSPKDEKVFILSLGDIMEKRNIK